MNGNQFRMEVTAAAGSTSGPVFFPARARDISIRALPGEDGSATVYFTLDDPKEVEADPNNAKWDAWEEGTVSQSTTVALAGRVTAVRIAASNAPAIMQVVAALEH